MKCDNCQRELTASEPVYRRRTRKKFGPYRRIAYNGSVCQSCNDEFDRHPYNKQSFSEYRCKICDRPVFWGAGRKVVKHMVCSAECAAKAHRANKTSTKRICENCSESFLAKRKDAKYCSPKCRQAARRSRQ